MGFTSSRFCARSKFLPVLVGWLVCLLLSHHARAQSDNFDNGTDPGWTHYDPMAAYGSPGTFTFPNFAYRIHANISPAPDPKTGLGPARMASYHSTPSYSDFYESVDIVNFDTSLNQAFGLLSHLTSVGLSTTNGYALTYTNNDHDLNLSLINGEAATTLVAATSTAQLQPGHSYHMVFTGVGSLLSGHLYDNSNPSVSLADLSAIDSTHPQGANGLLVYDNSGSSGNFGADATFDNFSAAVVAPEPASLALIGSSVALVLLKRRRSTLA